MSKKRMKKGKYVLISAILCILVGIIGLNNKKVDGIDNEELKRKAEVENLRKDTLHKAEELKKEYYIDEAIELLSNQLILNEEVESKLNKLKEYKSSFVKYEGDIEHIFVHSLIVYPELAFDNKGHDSNGYNMWFNTNTEFKKILPLLKEKGYVLMRITDIYSKDENGNMKRNDIYLPEGKKPLIISQDDVNYYEYMRLDGFADRLVIDEKGEVSTIVRNKDNKEEITRDGDMVPILDDFIKENPDFSYKGAKGILAVTGYEGVLGYRLDSEENKNEAVEVAKKLKENGWLFASHSYTHNGKGFFGDNPVYSKLQYDFSKWKQYIEPIIGETNIFIAPYGTTLKGKNFQLAKEHGFDIYCNVARNTGDKIVNNTIINPRFNIDGFSFNKAKEMIDKRFFNVDRVIDKERPALKIE